MAFVSGDSAAWPRIRLRLVLLFALLLEPGLRPVWADDTPPRESTDDAWWTGPLLTLPAATLPQGSWVVAAALWDEISTAEIDAHGHRASILHENAYGFMPFALYGVTDDFDLGFFPTMGFDQGSRDGTSSNPELGDWTLEAQYRFTEFHEGGWVPTIAINLGETFPIGQFDRLTRMGDGLGAGAYVTSLSLYTQSWYWMPTGRILRVNLNFSYSLDTSVGLSGRSVYGTEAGFLGRANPGATFFADLALEYSLSQQWVAMTEFAFEQDGNTRITGRDGMGSAVLSNSGTGDAFYITPSLAYSFNATKGVTFGVRFLAGGRNETVTMMPMLVFDWYLAPDE